MDVRLDFEQRLHVVGESLWPRALLLAAEQQHMVRRAAAIAGRDHVQERNEVLAHSGRQLLRQAEVQQHQLQLRTDLFQRLVLGTHPISLQHQTTAVVRNKLRLSQC